LGSDYVSSIYTSVTLLIYVIVVTGMELVDVTPMVQGLSGVMLKVYG
jgi:hypothetical protein